MGSLSSPPTHNETLESDKNTFLRNWHWLQYNLKISVKLERESGMFAKLSSLYMEKFLVVF